MAVPETTKNAPIQALGAGGCFMITQRIGRAAIGEIDESVDITPVSPPLRPNNSSDMPTPMARNPLAAICRNTLALIGTSAGEAPLRDP